MVPLKQSDVDGLCGMFSVINSLRLLYPDCLGDQEDPRTQDFVTWFVDDIDHWFLRRGMFHDIWQGGCISGIVLEMLNSVKRYGFDIEITRVNKLVKSTNERDFWADAKTLLDEQSVIIAGFEDPDPHWTVIRKISDKFLYHFDSSIYNKTKIEDTNTSEDNSQDWYFNRSDIFLIRRK